MFSHCGLLYQPVISSSGTSSSSLLIRPLTTYQLFEFDKGSTNYLISPNTTISDGTTIIDPETQTIHPSIIQYNWVRVCSNWNGNTMLIRDDGTLWVGRGYNNNPLPPLYATTSNTIPNTTLVQFDLDTDWYDCAMSGDGTFDGTFYHQLCFALKTDGSLWKWGTGQDNVTYSTKTRVNVGTDPEFDWISIFGPAAHGVLAQKANGDLYKMDATTSTFPYYVYFAPANELKRPSSLLKKCTINKQKSIVCLYEDGTLWAEGTGGYGMLGQGNATDSIGTLVQIPGQWVDVYCPAGHNFGYYDTLVYGIKNDGTLWAWGRPYFSTAPVLSPTIVPVYNVVSPTFKSISNGYALMTDNTIVRLRDSSVAALPGQELSAGAIYQENQYLSSTVNELVTYPHILNRNKSSFCSGNIIAVHSSNVALPVYTDTITTDILTGYVIITKATSLGWDGISPFHMNITVNAGVYVIGTGNRWTPNDGTIVETTPAIDATGMPEGSTVTITNHGYILGRGGSAVTYNTQLVAGGGFTAIRLKYLGITIMGEITNYGTISGGGGAGGSGWLNSTGHQYGGGGAPYGGSGAQQATLTTGGTGTYINTINYGGTGGGWGSGGTNGKTGGSYTSGASAGMVIEGNAGVIWHNQPGSSTWGGVWY